MKKEEAIKIIDCYDIGFYDLSGAKYLRTNWQMRLIWQ